MTSKDIAATSRFNSPVLVGRGPAERLRASMVTANFFSPLGAAPALGRLLVPGDDSGAASPVAVLSHRLWTSRFGGDRNVIGQTIVLDTSLYTIGGVTRPEFRSSAGPHFDANAWLFLTNRVSTLTVLPVTVVARLRPDVTLDVVRMGLHTVTSREWAPPPRTPRELVAVVTPLRDAYVGPYREPVLAVLGAVAALLLIACVNASARADRRWGYAK